jgi:hypothetical protein
MMTVACTMMADVAFGRTCRSMIHTGEASMVRAPSTKSLSLMRRVSPRTTRIMVGIWAMPRAIAALPRLGPLMAASPTAMMRNGKARVTSVRREMTASNPRE